MMKRFVVIAFLVCRGGGRRPPLPLPVRLAASLQIVKTKQFNKVILPVK